MPDDEFIFASNAMRLTGRQWVVTAVVAVAAAIAVPALWPALEPLEAGPQYRLPYALHEDYYLVARWCRRAAETHDVLALGDSVVWGEYVAPDQTLPAALNRRAGRHRVANLGLNGLHPVAMAALVRHHAPGLDGRKVLLVLNLMWMRSGRTDLSAGPAGDEAAWPVNQPALLPQVWPPVPAYTATWPRRVRTVLARHIPLLQWRDHVALAYYHGLGTPDWTAEHPYRCPFEPLDLHLPAPADAAHSPPRPWRQGGLQPLGLEQAPWVSPDDSLQWRYVRETLDALNARGADVFVVVLPLNVHMLSDPSRARYERLHVALKKELAAAGMPHHALETLPSALYADVSHPLAEGYERWAGELWAAPSFRTWLEGE